MTDTAAPSDTAGSVPQRSGTFEKAVANFRQGLTEELKVEFAACSLQDVELEIQRVQQQYGPDKKLRSMRRLSKFLEAMSQLEEVVKVFLNVHEAVAFVWVITACIVGPQ